MENAESINDIREINFYTTSERNKAHNELRDNSMKSTIQSFTSILVTNEDIDFLRKHGHQFQIDLR